MTSHRPGFMPPSSSGDGDPAPPDPGPGHPPVIPPLLAAPHFMSGMGNLMGAAGEAQ